MVAQTSAAKVKSAVRGSHPRPIAILVCMLSALAGCKGSGAEESAPAGAHKPWNKAQDYRAHEDPWIERSDTELQKDLQLAKERAKREKKLVLLEFVAGWCPDCREVVRVSGQEPVRSVVANNFVRLYVNVGHFDLHRKLLKRFGVRSIVTLIVLRPDGSEVARTNYEPVSKDEKLTPEELASWYRSVLTKGRRG